MLKILLSDVTEWGRIQWMFFLFMVSGRHKKYVGVCYRDPKLVITEKKIGIHSFCKSVLVSSLLEGTFSTRHEV